MKKYTQLTIMLPCHSLEDFPLHHEGDDAQGLLANWTAMFHPALIHSAGAMPSWSRMDDPPEELAGRLLLIPTVSAGDIPAGFPARAKNEGAVVISRKTDRDEIIAEALAAIEIAGGKPPAASRDLTADFLALGYCYLQVELLTRQMRYASNLDELYFGTQLVAAANAAMADDEPKARELLQSCFDVLGEERDHFYPVDAFLMDLTLVAETTMGQTLRDELQSGSMVNLLISGGTLAKMASDEPETLAALKSAIAESRVSLVGGEFHEGPANILNHEAMLAELRHGLATYEEHLGTRPTIFGRRRFGLSPWLPQVLKKLGFNAAIHATFDGGNFPDGSQTKTMWEGHDGTQLNALARPPHDASRPESFLNFCRKMGDSMDSDHVATLYFAHWPGQSSAWFEDLRRIASWGPALGKFTTLDEYFKESDHGGLTDRFDGDAYKPPYLKQAVIREEANAISRMVEHYRGAMAEQTAGAMNTITSLLTGKVAEQSRADFQVRPRENAAATADGLGSPSYNNSGVDDAVEGFSESLPRSGGKQPGYLVANPQSFVRRICVAAPELDPLPTVEKPIYAVGESEGQKHIVVDVPPMGFAWVTGGDGGASKSQKPLVEEGVLRNEFFEIRFDETTGAMRSLHDYENRSNRMSQQLAFRVPANRGGNDDGKSVMVAESIDVTLSDAAVGEITTRGRLVDTSGKELAGFVQRYRAVRGSRVLQIDIELDPQEMPRADAWNSYYACRFAWADESANLVRTTGGVREGTHLRRFAAPLYIDLDVPKQRTAILTGGLPYHRRVGGRMLDTLLIVDGEQARKFRLGVGIELTHPLQESLSLLTPETAVFKSAAPPSGPASSWLFHVDSKNVVATHWEATHVDDKVTGFRVRLLEGYGRAATVTLSCFRKVTSARKVDMLGQPIDDCDVSGDKISFAMDPREWAEIEVTW